MYEFEFVSIRWITFIYDWFNIFQNVSFFFRLIRIGNWKIFRTIEYIRNLRNIRRQKYQMISELFNSSIIWKKLLKIALCKKGGRNKETHFTVHRIYCLPSYLDRTENLHASSSILRNKIITNKRSYIFQCTHFEKPKSSQFPNSQPSLLT